MKFDADADEPEDHTYMSRIWLAVLIVVTAFWAVFVWLVWFVAQRIWG